MKLTGCVLICFAFICSIYAEECNLVKSQWCTTLENAVACDAVDHCTETYWKNDHETVSDYADGCVLCMKIVGEIHNLIDANVTKETIKNFVDMICDNLIFPELMTMCREDIEDHVDDIIDLIAKDVDPGMICKLLTLCSDGSEKSYELEATDTIVERNDVVIDRKVGDICEDCIKLMRDIENKITNESTVQEIEDLIKLDLCSLLPYEFMRESCESMVTAYIPQIVDLIFETFDLPSLCQVIELCEGDRKLLLKMKLKGSPIYGVSKNVKTGVPCQVCKTVINELKNLEANSSVEIVKYLEDNLCSYLGSYKDLCVKTIDEYGLEILALINDELDADKLCCALGLCNPSVFKVEVKRFERLQSSPVDSPLKFEKVTHEVLGNGFECEICKSMAEQISKLIQNNETLNEIVQELEKVCVVLPGPYKEQCKAFIQMYGEALIDLLIQQLDPEKVCELLKFCGADISYMHLIPTIMKSDFKLNGDGNNCFMCMIFVTTIEGLVERKATKEQIEEVMKQLCLLLPEKEAELCTKDFADNIDKIIDFIASHSSPIAACKDLGFCS